MPDKNIIKYGGMSDTPLPIIQDELPERSSRFFVYKLDKTGKVDRPFIGINAISIVSYVTAEGDRLIDDEASGYKYMVGAKVVDSNNEFLEGVDGTSTVNDDKISILTNDFYLNSDQELHIVTKDVPFDPVAYSNDEQKVFLITNSSMVSEDVQEDISEYQLDNENLAFIQLTNIRLITQSYSNSKLMFEYNVNFSDFTVDVDGTEEQGFNLNMKSDELLSSVSVTGLNDSDNKVTFDIDTNKKMIPVRLAPTNIRNKTTQMFGTWFDYDSIPPFFFIDKFRTDTTIPDAMVQIADELNESSDNASIGPYIELISDVLTFSTAFINNFKDFDRLTTEGDVGKLDPAQKVGFQDQYIIALEGRDPITVIDGLISDWRKENPGLIDGPMWSVTKMFIQSLSNYTISSLSVAGGDNEFVDLYNPWFLKNSITIELEERTNPASFRVDLDEIEFILDSKWFDFTEGSLLTPTDSNISIDKIIQSERKVSIQPLPSVLLDTPVRLLPIEVTPESASLNYNFYIPNESVELMRRIYINDASTQGDGSEEIVEFRSNTEFFYKDEIAVVGNAVEFIIDDAASKIPNIDSSQINFINQGTLADQGYARFEMPAIECLDWIPANDSVWSNYLNGGLSGTGWRTTTGEVLEDQSWILYWTLINQVPGSPDFRNLNDDWKTDIEFYVEGGRVTDARGTWLFEMQASRYEQYLVSYVGVPVSIEFLDREVLFSKSKWKNTINNYLSLDPNAVYNIDIPVYTSDTIRDIYEISIRSVWNESIDINIGGRHFVVESLNSRDETLSEQKIIFT